MDIIVNLLKVLHLLGLVLGMGSGLAMTRIWPIYGASSEEQRSVLFKMGRVLGKNGHVGLALLWVTGILIVWLDYGGIDAFSWWFWAKIVFAIVLSASVGIGSKAYRRFAAGDMGASARVELASKVSGISGVLIILFAVFAFA